jgi:enoyl-CoA hydratase/carnithine racemase
MIYWTQKQGIAQLILDRPETRNALGVEDWRAFAEMLEEIVRADARLIMLRSTSPKAFCSGSDLKEIAALASDVEARGPFRVAMRSAIDRLADLPIPVVALIDGACFGAGVALALGCDIRLASPAARFCVPPAKYGIGYPIQDIRRLAAAVGRSQAARLMFTAQLVSAAEASAIGLVDMVCEDLEAQGENMAQAIAANDPASLALLKDSLANIMAPNDSGFDAKFDDMFGSSGFISRVRPR